MAKEVAMKAFMYNNIHRADLRPPAGGRPGEGPLGRPPGVVQQSNSSDNLKG